MADHEDQIRHVVIPIEIMRLEDDGDITWNEVKLLTKLNTLQQPEVGCWASDKWLANWWGKGVGTVENALRKFDNLGLIKRTKVKYRRHIYCLFQPPTTPKKLGDPPLKNKGSIVTIKKHTKKRNKAASPLLSLGEIAAPRTGAQKLAQLLHEGLILQRKMMTAKPNLFAWAQAFETMKGHVPAKRIKEVIEWYLENMKDPFVPSCNSGPTFVKRFDNIEKAMLRKNPQKKRTKQIRKAVWVNGYKQWQTIDVEA